MPGDALYWSPAELDSDDSFNSKDHHIDPWDLENYAYIREHLESMELSLSSSGSSREYAEANSNSFYYVPGDRRGYPRSNHSKSEDRRGYDSVLSDQENYAAIDELRQDGRKRSEIHTQDKKRIKIRKESESETDETNSSLDPYVKENPVFGIYDEKGIFRRVALPIMYTKPQRDRSLSFAYGDYEYDLYSLRTDIYSRLEDYRDNDATLPIYDDVRRNRRKPDNFGLSKYGHLKIDYSCSWNNLNKYMKHH